METHSEKSGPLPGPQSPETSLHERPIGELLTRLSHDTSLLLEQEIALAKREAYEKLDQLKVQVASLAVGGVVLHAGLLVLVAAAVLLLALWLPAWAAALAVGVALAAGGAILLIRGKEGLKKLELAPQATIRNVKQDVRTVKEAAQ